MEEKKNYILLSEKKWHLNLFNDLKNKISNSSWFLINSKEDFNLKKLKSINPSKIFIPHWSYIIQKEIYLKYECVIFHMTDLPYGRGGSPLQNLIVRGFKKTKISALKVDKDIDAGDIYMKMDLDLSGSAKEIFSRSVPIIYKMIKEILENKKIPYKQKGDVVHFKRRVKSDGDISAINKLDKVYDYIRMLDAEGYPSAFMEFSKFKIEFTNVKKISKNILNANVRIFKK